MFSSKKASSEMESTVANYVWISFSSFFWLVSRRISSNSSSNVVLYLGHLIEFLELVLLFFDYLFKILKKHGKTIDFLQ